MPDDPRSPFRDDASTAREPGAAADPNPAPRPPVYGEEFGEEICPLEPGARCGGRYRLLEKLGEGGMGEVWKARDEALRQLVALKFLGRGAVGAAAVEALRNEVRLARRVSHPNVCRVHDLGQVGDRTFLSMEFVDGESLDRLIRRIGRLPFDKSREIVRQLAVGLHAAHEQGVLHRDLKPANVMIDGRGDVRITDFGIAGLVDGQPAEEGSAGTPGYMAPELFRGGKPSVQSDLWSLGCILHELHTGRRLMKADSLQELLDLHRRPIAPPSRTVPELDPAIDSLVGELLDPEPSRRPVSALSVLSRLSGGDLLADVIRAGRTPSPDLVAAAGGEAGRGVRSVVALLLLFAVAMVGAFGFEADAKLVAQVELPESGEVLASLTRRTLDALGVARPGADRAWSFDANPQTILAMGAREGPGRFASIGDPDRRAPPIDFWYRTSPEPLIPVHISGMVRWSDPAFDVPGMSRVRVDPEGRLLELQVVPGALAAVRDATSEPPTDNPAVHLDALRAAAGLAHLDFEATVPVLTPTAFADRHQAWAAIGAEPRIEFATLADELVWARVYDAGAASLGVYASQRATTGGIDLFTVLRVPALLVAVFLAAHALRSRRADVKGTMRLGYAIFGLVLAVTLLTGNHSADPAAEGSLWLRGMARSLLVAFQYALFYMALEPHVRRIWPEIMISWSRVLRGNFTDPDVGFSIVIGVALGAAAACAVFLGRAAFVWTEGERTWPLLIRERTMEVLHGGGFPVGAILEIVAQYTDIGMVLALLLVVFRDLLGTRRRAGLALFVLLFAGWSLSLPSRHVVSVALLGLVSAGAVLALVRGGVLSAMVGLFTFRMLLVFPLRTDLDHWLGAATMSGVGVLVAMAGFGAWTALRPRGVGAGAGTLAVR